MMKSIRTTVMALVFAMFTASLSYTDPALILPEKTDLHMLVIFTKFKGELPDMTEAPWWANRLFNGPGSIPEYWDEVSDGRIRVSGEYLFKVYELPTSGYYYRGKSDKYANNVIRMVDEDIDFGRCDNDGPDGIPNSGDDDKRADYVVLMPLCIQQGLIWNNATGLASIPVGQYQTNDSAHDSDKHIFVYSSHGCIAGATNPDMAIGSICHEFCHALGGVDLYDLDYGSPSLDSAGIGDWGVMGRGTSGWNGKGGPVAPCAYTRMIIDCATPTDLFGTMKNIRISGTSSSNATIYRVWAGSNEYFLISYRRNDRLYCDRNLPGSGLLIWHIYDYGSNRDETDKKCDLECADGLYTNAGYPLGETPDPVSGRDNLDFWAHGKPYEEEHAGNRGDATDMFDGVRYTRFGPDTNPSSYSHKLERDTGIIIDNIRRDGEDMLFDITAPVGQAVESTTHPLFGAGWQGYSFGLQCEQSSVVTTYYLIRYDDHSRATLVSVSGDSTNVMDISGENREEIMAIVDGYLLSVAARLQNGAISRENIKKDEFVQTSGLTDITMDDDSIRIIQKISLVSSFTNTPVEVIIGQNFPNPFNGSTLISYRVPLVGTYRFEVYNMLGQRIHCRDLGLSAPGTHHVRFSPDDFASGVYLYRITGTAESACNKMLYVR